MAILDKKLEFFDATSIVTGYANVSGVGICVSSDDFDLGVAYDGWGQSRTPDIGEGGELYFNARVATTMTPADVGSASGHGGTLVLYHHTTTTASSGTVLLTKAVPIGTTAGTSIFRQKLPAGTIKRYLAAVYISNATSATAGALDAWISRDSESEVPVT